MASNDTTPRGIAANVLSCRALRQREWRALTLKDDPVLMSNTRGRVSFAMAGKGTRSTQLFINFGDNKRLDPEVVVAAASRPSRRHDPTGLRRERETD